jgi:hypothetical protein
MAIEIRADQKRNLKLAFPKDHQALPKRYTGITLTDA